MNYTVTYPLHSRINFTVLENGLRINNIISNRTLITNLYVGIYDFRMIRLVSGGM